MAANDTVTTNASTATRLDSTDESDAIEVVYVRGASADMFIGDEDVDSTDGWPYGASDDPMAFRVPAGGLWAIASSGTPTIKVFRVPAA